MELPARADETPRRRPEVVAVYYPHWHVYDHGKRMEERGMDGMG